MSESTSPNTGATAAEGAAITGTTDPLKLLSQVLAHAVRVNASDIHLRTRNHPILRVDGNLLALREIPPLPPEFMERLSRTMMSARLLAIFEKAHQVDLSIGFKDIGRVRANIFYQRGSIGMVLRVISTNIPAPEELFLPDIVMAFTKLERGLVLLTGSTGSGKSTTLASLINSINLSRSEHIITIEDPVEFLFSEKRSIITQPEIRIHTKTF